MKHSLAAWLTCVASASIVTPALAQTQDGTLGASHRGKESPQNFAAELRFAAFTPDVDSDPALQGKTPYKDTFGSKPRLEIGIEVDWQVLRIPHLGTIGPGLSAGYAKASDPALFQMPQPNGNRVSGEQTSLEIFPFYGVIVLRGDALWREAGIPLVPYGKIGLGYALWRASNTLGTSTSMNGVSGEGHAIGTQIALGLALNLNPFDVYAAQNFDDSLGVNNSYIFAEWTRSNLNGLFSETNVLRVGGTAWTFGLAFEF